MAKFAAANGHTTIYIYIYIYIYAVVFDFGVLFLAQCVRQCSGPCVRKWGARRPREGNPYFYSVWLVSEGQQLAQQAPEICRASRGNMLKTRHFPRRNPDCDLCTRTLTSSEYELSTCPSRADMSRTAGRMGFSGLWSRNFDGKAQNQGPGKMAKYICVGAPLLILCVLVARLDFAKNGFLKIDNFLLKPLKT